MVLMCKANGKSSITENIFENRFMHVAELRRLGAKINVNNNKAYIYGNTKFIGAELMSSDLRASVSLVLAAMVSKGKAIILAMLPLLTDSSSIFSAKDFLKPFRLSFLLEIYFF